MPINFGELPRSQPGSRPSDPIALFQSLRVSDSAINDLWLAQGDALREWNTYRGQSDIAVVLNTGAGKTLVGLLIAQALVNETNGHVLYACSSIQLVQQTAALARGYGLEATTYFGGDFNNHLFRQAQAPCITTYQALFNGRSIFSGEDLSAIVFDDAHTASHLLRDQFTLRISRGTFPDAFNRLAQLFRHYFTDIGKDMSYSETLDRQNGATSHFVPPFVVNSQLAEIHRILLSTSLAEETETMFAWEHLRDHLDICAVFVSGIDLTFTPAVVPVRRLRCFDENVRRVYLSATLTAKDAFQRSFGSIPDPVIAPSTTAGECERMILVPGLNELGSQRNADVAAAKRIVENQKGLVIVPTRRRAQLWDDITTEYDVDVTSQIELFKTAGAPACFVLTARYDGVDFPGDTCRVLVLDDLPTGLNPLERYMWEQLGLLKLLRSTVASRIVQSFGRISRGMSDHGVVVLTGSRLVDWILTPVNQKLLPEFLQRQIRLGIDASRLAGGTRGLVEAAVQCLARDPGWIRFYQQEMENFESVPVSIDEDGELVRIAQDEVAFGDAMWGRDYEGAARALERNLEDTFTTSRPTGAWHALWLGYCYALLGDDSRALDLYRRAHQAHSNIPPFHARIEPSDVTTYSAQARSVVAVLVVDSQQRLQLPTQFDIELAALDGSGSVAQTEAALEALGKYLGLEASRPDNELGSGPDVLWLTPDKAALCIEAKTAKRAASVYRKRDLGQLRDHRQWVSDVHNPVVVHPVFVGPVVPASQDANPDCEMIVVELAEFRILRDRFRAALIDICASAVPATSLRLAQDKLAERKLTWPELYQELPKHILKDISGTPPLD